MRSASSARRRSEPPALTSRAGEPRRRDGGDHPRATQRTGTSDRLLRPGNRMETSRSRPRPQRRLSGSSAGVTTEASTAPAHSRERRRRDPHRSERRSLVWRSRWNPRGPIAPVPTDRRGRQRTTESPSGILGKPRISADHDSEARGKRTRGGRRKPTGPTRDARWEAIGSRSERVAKRPGASETRPSSFPAPPCRWSKRHEGTDRGDAVRLSTRSSSKGVNSVARRSSTILGSDPKVSSPRNAANIRPAAGRNKPAKPRWSKSPRQCETAKAERERTVGTVRPKESRKRLREWTPWPTSVGMTGRPSPREEGSRAQPGTRALKGRPSEGGPDRGSGNGSRTRGVSERPRRRNQKWWNAREGAGRPTNRYRNDTIRTEYRCESNLEPQANLMRATAQADSNPCSTL
jgi:hypothetical protein